MVVVSAFLYIGCTCGPLLFLSINVVVPFIWSEIVLLTYCECFGLHLCASLCVFLEITVCFSLTHLREKHYIQQCLFAPTVTNYNEQASQFSFFIDILLM